MRFVIWTIITGLFIAICGLNVSFAEEQFREYGGPPGEVQMGEPFPKESRQEVEKKIETLRKWRLIEELGLNEAESSSFMAAESLIESRRKEVMREEIEAMRELRMTLKDAQPDKNKLESILERLEKNRKEMLTLKEEEMQAVRKYLSIEQQARYLIFQREFQREILKIIQRARGDEGRGGDMPMRQERRFYDGPREGMPPSGSGGRR